MDAIFTNPYSPWLAITLAALASYASRGLGAALSGRIDPASPVIAWITAVTYALMAGLVARMIILPVGALSATPDWMRLLSAGICLGVFFLARRNVAAGVFAGSLALMALSWN